MATQQADQGPTGVTKHDPERCYEGYTLFSVNGGSASWLIDPQTEQLVWQWWLHEHVEELRDVGIVFPRPIDVRSKDRRGDLFHCNTPEVLPDTALGRHDRRFRAGNILLSYRQLDVIYIADRDSGDTEKENKYGPSRPNTNRHTSQQALLQQGPLLRPPTSVRNPQLR